MLDLIVDCYPTREAWLHGRRDPLNIGASEAAVVLGVSPYADAWSFWEKKTGQAKGEFIPDDADAFVLSRGNRWEPVVLEEYGIASESTIVEPGENFGRKGHIVTLSNPAFPWLRSSPDAFAIDKWGTFGHVEAKTALDRDAWTRDRGIIIDKWADRSEELLPPHYAVQAYSQLAVSGLPWNDVCALVPSSGWLEVRWVRLMRDADTQDAIVEACAAWRDKHLVRGEAPDVDGTAACNRYLARRLNVPDARARRMASEEEATKIHELAALRATIGAAEDRVKVLTNELVVAAGESIVAVAEGKKAPYGQAQKVGAKETIDTKKLKTEFPEAHAACKRTGAASVWFATYRFEKQTKESDDS